MLEHSVVKEVTFDCCHMLSDYAGACANLHGHTYRLQIELAGAPVGGKVKELALVSANERPVSGYTLQSSSAMVMDFKDLKKIIQTQVMDKMDHALIISSFEYRNEEETALLAWAKAFNKKVHIIQGRSTAETMSKEIFEAVQAELFEVNPEIIVSSVRLWETPTSYAEYRRRGECRCE